MVEQVREIAGSAESQITDGLDPAEKKIHAGWPREDSATPVWVKNELSVDASCHDGVNGIAFDLSKVSTLLLESSLSFPDILKNKADMSELTASHLFPEPIREIITHATAMIGDKIQEAMRTVGFAGSGVAPSMYPERMKALFLDLRSKGLFEERSAHKIGQYLEVLIENGGEATLDTNATPRTYTWPKYLVEIGQGSGTALVAMGEDMAGMSRRQNGRVLSVGEEVVKPILAALFKSERINDVSAGPPTVHHLRRVDEFGGRQRPEDGLIATPRFFKLPVEKPVLTKNAPKSTASIINLESCAVYGLNAGGVVFARVNRKPVATQMLAGIWPHIDRSVQRQIVSVARTVYAQEMRCKKAGRPAGHYGEGTKAAARQELA